MKNIVISGPTASGKTLVAVKLAKLINGEIISADSRQVYKYLDIGTNKTGEWNNSKKARLYEGIPQYLTDIIEPSETFSAGEFQKECAKFIKKITSRKKVSIIVGGTGLYVKALIDGLAPLPEKDDNVRNELLQELKNFGIEYVYNKLKSVDPKSATKNKNNPQRIIRALEVYYLTGTPISELHKNTKPLNKNFVQFGISWPREQLYDNLDKRCLVMLDSGMIAETKQALKKGYSSLSPGLQGIGYRHIIAYIENKIKFSEIELLLKRDSRRYAKRQLTWFNKDKRINWIETDQYSFNPETIASQISKML